MAGICLVCTAPTVRSNLQAVERYRSSIDYVELRVDLLEPDEIDSARGFPGMCDIPVICTVRRETDGGRFGGGEAERLALLESLADSGFAYVDLELDLLGEGPAATVETAFRRAGARIIRSFHDFQGVPDLEGLYDELSSKPDEIPKIAVYPKSFADAMRLYRVARSRRGREQIILGMGTFGFFTRILAEKMGSLFTFTSPDGTSAAPGHIDPVTLEEVYRYRSIGDGTRICCVIADPVMHSRSPWIHNPAFEAEGLDLVYVPLHVDDPDAFFDYWDDLDIVGASVTIPHKERVIGHLAYADDAVQAIGSCNTLIRDEGGFRGYNTDAPGFLAAAESLFPNGRLPGKALVIGAGGTSRSVIYALVSRKIDVLIVNRTIENARVLAARYGCRYAGLGESSVDLIGPYSDLIVQTSSAGMTPNTDDPLWFYEFGGHEAVFDVVYAPPSTPLVGRARAAGCRVINGWQMLLEQAYVQFEHFTGRPYPRSVAIDEPG